MNKSLPLVTILASIGFSPAYSQSTKTIESKKYIINYQDLPNIQVAITAKDARGNVLKDVVLGNRFVTFEAAGKKPFFGKITGKIDFLDGLEIEKQVASTTASGQSVWKSAKKIKVDKGTLSKLNELLRKPQAVGSGIPGLIISSDLKVRIDEKLSDAQIKALKERNK